jgi:hypothetical protein
MKLTQFLLAILAGRFVRFLVLAILVLVFGPNFVRIFGVVFKQHWPWVLAALSVGLAIWLVVVVKKRKM